MGISALLHAALLFAAGIAWIKAPHTSVTPGRNSIEIELMAEAEAAPTSTPSTPEPAAIPTPVRAQKVEPIHCPCVASNGAREASPDALHNPPPAYPEAARLAHEQGLVMIEVEVTAQGTPAEVRLSHSSGYPRLDQAALKAVRNWKFEPARLGGIPVASRVLVPVKFQLQ